MPIDMQELMDRVAALEVEALASLSPPVTADAVDRFFHTQSTYPYFVNKLGAITIEGDSEEADEYTVNVQMRLIMGYVTEGYEGEVENRLQVYIPQVITYFNEREGLQSIAFSETWDDLKYARIVACTGHTIWQGSGSQIVGTEWTLECHLFEEITQAYL